VNENLVYRFHPENQHHSRNWIHWT